MSFQERQKYIDLLDILDRERMQPVFQPIIDLASGGVFEYEALSRVVGESAITWPGELFFTISKKRSSWN